MMRHLLIILALLSPSLLFAQEAGPFGLKWGMSQRDFVDGGGRVLTEDTSIYGKQVGVAQIPKALADTQNVILLFGDDDKLWRVYTESTRWPNDKFGSSVKLRFDEIRSLLVERYGKSKDYFRTPKDSFFSDPDQFAYGISKKERSHASFWSTKDLEIELVVRAEHEATYYSLSYEFKPIADIIRKKGKSKEKDAL